MIPRPDRHMRSAVRGVLLPTAAFLCLCAPAVAEEAWSLDQLIKAHYVDTLALLPTVTLLALLAFTVQIDSYIRPEQKRTMRLIVATVFSLVAQNYIEYLTQIGVGDRLLRTVVAIYGYSIRPVILVLFLRLVAPKRRLRWAWTLVAINMGIHLTALFSPVCFVITEGNHYIGGPLSNTCLYVSMILLIALFCVTSRVFFPMKRGETWVPAIALILILGATLLDDHTGTLNQPVSYCTIAVVISCNAYYIWLHLQFVHEHERELLAGQRMQMMLSQIKPHFLYNVLGVIEELCVSDPPAARSATNHFSRYLRGNMYSLTNDAVIPFDRELEHTKLYLELEQLRFEDALDVRYDIGCTSFSLPQLTLEPLAENAVRHGVRGREDGRGTVTIRSREHPDRYEITVIDDGIGFDPAEPFKDEKLHVGIENVKNRLRRMCGGVLLLDSTPGKGTTATIILPKRKEA